MTMFLVRVTIAAAFVAAPVLEINGQAARMMLLVEEPGTHRLFVNDLRGPLVEYAQTDPLFQRNSGIILGGVYRRNALRQLSDLLLFGDNPSGEIFDVPADTLPTGGQDSIRRILFADKGTRQTRLELIREKNAKQASRR